MTVERGDDPVGDPPTPRAGDPANPEAAVISLLARLPTPEMPAAVEERLMAALRDEAVARAAAGLGPSRPPHAAPARRLRPRIVLGLCGAAAASLVAAVVLTSSDDGPGSPSRINASVVSVSTSGTAYRGAGLAQQVNERWAHVAPARHRATLSPSPSNHASSVVQSPGENGITTIAPDEPTAPEVLEASFARTHDGVVACLGRLAPDAEPLMIDMGTFEPESKTAPTPAAVIVYADATPPALDVYVVDRSCSLDRGSVLAHVTAAPTRR